MAVDPVHDLALLQVSPPANSLPLEPARGSPAVGASVMVIGHPQGGAEGYPPKYKGLLDWSLSVGVVSAKNEHFIQTDAAVNHGNSGGPLLDCEGRVLGVIASYPIGTQGVAFASDVGDLIKLLPQAGRQGSYWGEVRATGDLGFIWQVQPNNPDYLGVSFGLGAIAYDRLLVRPQFSFLWMNSPDTNTPLHFLSGERFLMELVMGYRAMFAKRSYVMPTLGAGVMWEWSEVNSYSLRFGDPSCINSTGGCQTQESLSQIKSRKALFVPSAGLSLNIGDLEIGYAYQMRTDDTSLSAHRMLFALTF